MTHEELLALGLTEEQAGAVRAALEAMEAQLQALKQTEVENAALRAELTEIQQQLQLRDKRDAVLSALPAFKPRDVQLLLRLIDLAKIQVTDGKISGLDTQVQDLRERAPYLFLGLPDPVGGSPMGGIGPTEFDMNAFLRGER